MLPRKLYELLPFLYMFTGLVCAVLIDSSIVLISSMLLIVTGVFVLLMRRSFRKSINRNYKLYQAGYELAVDDDIERRTGIDRRQRMLTSWPALDDKGYKIESDRRNRERRISAD